MPIGWFDGFFPCTGCQRRLRGNHYSLFMTLNGATMPDGTRHHQMTCNECAVKRRSKWARLLYMGHDTSWMEKAVCGDKDVNPEVFFLLDRQSLKLGATRAWDKYCKQCPVIKQCAAHGEITQSYGVWGGQYYAPGHIAQGPTEREQEMAERMKDLWDREGMSLREIAKETGTTFHIVRGVLRRAGLVPKK